MVREVRWDKLQEYRTEFVKCVTPRNGITAFVASVVGTQTLFLTSEIWERSIKASGEPERIPTDLSSLVIKIIGPSNVVGILAGASAFAVTSFMLNLLVLKCLGMKKPSQTSQTVIVHPQSIEDAADKEFAQALDEFKRSIGELFANVPQEFLKFTNPILRLLNKYILTERPNVEIEYVPEDSFNERPLEIES